MATSNVIGIVGGIGPYASLDLVKKIFDNTITNRDQEHLPVILISKPEEIQDRSEFLLGKTDINPAYSIIKIIYELEKSGAEIIGIPCNTAHTSSIMDVIISDIQNRNGNVKLINIIDEVIKYIKQNYSYVKNVGILATNGTYYSDTYREKFLVNNYEVIVPTEDKQNNLLHPSIYDSEYGIKTQITPVSDKAIANIRNCIDDVISRGAEIIILACTELPLGIRENNINGVPVLDTTNILARALIREADKKRLKCL